MIQAMSQTMVPARVNLPESTPHQNINNTGATEKENGNRAQEAYKVELSKKAMESAGTEGPQSSSTIDAAIEKIKAQIKVLQKQLDGLKGREDESAVTLRKSLQGQISALNGQLMDLMATKIKELSRGQG